MVVAPRDSYPDLKTFRQSLIEACRIIPDGDFEAKLEKADAEDLAWLLETREIQDTSIRHLYPADSEPYARLLDRNHRISAIVQQIHGHKLTLGNRSRFRRTEFRLNLNTAVAVLSLLVAAFALFRTFIKP